jgi:hypothetical protein
MYLSSATAFLESRNDKFIKQTNSISMLISLFNYYHKIKKAKKEEREKKMRIKIKNKKI